MTGHVRCSDTGSNRNLRICFVLFCRHFLTRNTTPGTHIIKTVANERYDSMLALKVMIEPKQRR